MTGDEGRDVCEALLPPEERAPLCQPCGVLARARQRNRGMFVRAIVISAGTPGGADQADVLRSSLECEGPHVARAAYERWFDEPRARGMAAWLTHRGRDPNGRRRPAVLAQRRGWKRQPVVPNKAHGGDVSNGH